MDSKTYVIGDSNQSNMLSAIAPLLQQRGIDASTLAAMNNGGFGGNNFIWAIFLLAILGWGGNGFGFGNNNGNGAGFLANQLNNSEGRDLLMQAIQGNHDALNQLASTLQVNSTAVQTGFSNVMQSLCNIGNQVGQSSLQVINALQNGDMNIAQQIAAASSASQLSICQQTNSLQGSICDAKTTLNQGLTMLGFQSERQTGTITNAIKDSTQTIVDGQKAAEIRELNSIIAKQNTDLAELRAAASTRTIVDVSLAPVITQLTALQNAVAQISSTTTTTKSATAS